jgi:type IV pilus assembly protein PilQ
VKYSFRAAIFVMLTVALVCGVGEAVDLCSPIWWRPVAGTGDEGTASQTGTAKTHPAVVLETQEPRYTGEPISLSLKDADIKDVLKTFSTLTQLNIVVDPAVSGSVTVELVDVPWDQAFELILTINGLGYEMLGNVVYVAPVAKLARHPLYARWR